MPLLQKLRLRRVILWKKISFPEILGPQICRKNPRPQNPNSPPPIKRGILWAWRVFLQKEPKIPGAHKIGAAVFWPQNCGRDFYGHEAFSSESVQNNKEKFSGYYFCNALLSRGHGEGKGGSYSLTMLVILWPCCRGHLGPKCQKEFEMSSQGQEAPGGQKLQNGVEN